MDTPIDAPVGEKQPDVSTSGDAPLDAQHREGSGEAPADVDKKRFDQGAYVLLNTIKYAPSEVQLAGRRFIAVRLDRDLLVQKGHYLVVPLDVPDVVWDMPEHEYQSCFVPIVAATPEVKSAAPNAPDRDEPKAAEPVTEAPARPTMVQPQFSDRSPSRQEAEEPRRPVSPQMGRVLLAMLYLHEVDNHRQMAAHTIQAMLSPVDARQVSGMLSGAMRMRYVSRASAPDGGRAHHYMLNGAGKKVAQRLGTWPYDHRNLAVPPWLRDMLRGNIARPPHTINR